MLILKYRCGGTHITEWLLPLASSSWDAQERKVINEVLDSGMLTMGERTLEFERQFATWVGRRFAVMVNSGSSANLLAVAALKYSEFSKRKDSPEVLVPAVSWNTTFSPLEQFGFRIKLVDIDPNTFNISVDSLKASLSKNTVGIFGVNLLGNSADWLEIERFASEHDLWILEDNCESMGARNSSQMTGTYGLASTFSFFFSHHICTIEGGMVVTDNEEFSYVLRSMRAHGWSRGIIDGVDFLGEKRGNDWEENFRFYLPGFNLRPNEISAAIGSVQLKKFPLILEQRRRNAIYLQKLLKSRSSSWRLQEEFGQSSWFTFGLVNIDPTHGQFRRQSLINLFKINAIQSRPIVAGNIARHPVFKKWTNPIVSHLPSADLIHFQGLMIGNHHYDIGKELEKVVELIHMSENLS